ncbi:MAG TPA: HAMP domain-containing sensor histidine kinase [Terriglobales bacterium]|jgi:signal transduction histidine kinase|nr:HAMP domain-containing sensor histidine kinase [Terriglobales bacterium]
MSERSRPWIVGIAALVCAQAVASLFLRQSFALVALSDITQFILLLAGTIAMLPNVLATRGRIRLFWALMMLGMAFWMSYQGLWMYFEVLLRRDFPNPFGGDVVLFLHLVPMTAALAMQPHLQPNDRTTRLGTLDFALLLVWWLYLYLFAVIPWQYVHAYEPSYDHNLNILYLTEKVVYLAALGMLWIRSQGSWRVIYANWFGAGITYSLGSYLANWAIARKVYHTGSLYDVPLAVSMAWIAAIGIQALHSPGKQQPAHASGSYGVWVAKLGMAAIFSLPLFALSSLFDAGIPEKVRTFRLVLTLSSMLFMGALVFFKQHLLDCELLRLLNASQESFGNLKRVQAQLVQSEKLASLGQLVGGAAHELNNPLTAMMGYSDLLASTELSEDQKLLMQKIEHQVRRTRTLVSSLLSFAKQVPAEKTLVDINALVQTAVKLCLPQSHGSNVQVHTNFASELPRVLGDSNQLLQVCLHITNNALHALADSGGTLTVSARLQDVSVVLEFADNGQGMQEPERVFDPFYTTRPVGQGPGLGLSVCYGIIQEHNGKITCQNRPEGGAIFRIELPAVGDPAHVPSSVLRSYSSQELLPEAKAAATR